MIAAVNAGANAVYLAGEKYGARAYAENFSEAELIRIIREAHVYHVRVFLTANVLLRQKELHDATEFIRRLYEEGLDQRVIEGAVKAIKAADTLIIGGTSLTVYPAAGLIDYFHGENLILLNKSSTPQDSMANLVIHEPIGEVLSQIKVQ